MGRLKYFIVLLIIVASCNKNSEQISRSANPESGKFNILNILSFADTVDNLSKTATKQESLLYNLGDYTFHVSRYVRNSEVSLYIEYGNNGEYGKTEKRFYLKDGHIVLLIENTEQTLNPMPFSTTRSFYKNGKLLYSDQKKAKTEMELKNKEFKMTGLPGRDILADLKKLNDAIYQRGDFDLVFAGIAEYPKAKYLILSRDKFNAYRAPILVEKEDDFIRAIFSNPEKYRGRKLKINWALDQSDQAIYVSGGLP